MVEYWLQSEWEQCEESGVTAHRHVSAGVSQSDMWAYTSLSQQVRESVGGEDSTRHHTTTISHGYITFKESLQHDNWRDVVQCPVQSTQSKQDMDLRKIVGNRTKTLLADIRYGH